MGRPKGNQFKAHEIKNKSKAKHGHEKFVRITDDVMTGKAFLDLTGSQKVLYMYCKFQEYKEYPHPNNDPTAFTMNQAKWGKTYRLYAESNKLAFYKDMAALIEHGFVDCIENGFNTRTKSIYRLSSRWITWGTDYFTVPPNVWTKYMWNQKRKADKAALEAAARATEEVTKSATEGDRDIYEGLETK